MSNSLLPSLILYHQGFNKDVLTNLIQQNSILEEPVFLHNHVSHSELCQRLLLIPLAKLTSKPNLALETTFAYSKAH